MIADLKPYAEYKESGLPWLGQVPGHWEMRRMKSAVSNVVDQTFGMTPDDVYVALEHVESWTGRARPQRDSSLFTGQVKRFQEGDVLFGKLRPYLAKVARIASPGVCAGEFFVLRPNEPRLLASYLEQQLRAKPTIDVISGSTFGAKMPRADWQFCGNLPIPLPPPDEQAAIVRFLDWANGRLERAIRAKRKVIALLSEQKQAIIHRAVTRGLDPSVPLKPSGIPWLGDIPAHWEVRRLGSLLRERGEGNDLGEITHVLSLLRGRGVIPYDEKGNIGNKKSDDITRYKIVRSDDIVMNCMNVIIGSVGISRHTGCLSPVYYVLVRRNAADSPHYLNAIFQCSSFHRSLVRIGNGILAHRMRIPMELLKCELLPYPPCEEQAQIFQGLHFETEAFSKTISRLEREIDLLREYRTRLVADVVTGKLDVREAAARLPGEEPLLATPDTGDTDPDDDHATDEEADA
jgi:type I restriction enzyme S subunit